MFNNLIESSSHAKEFRRRGSFLLFTTATYAVLILVTGVISIYAYDAHLDAQSTEWEITFVPVLPEQAPPEQIRNTIRPAANNDTATPTRSMRTELIDSPDNPNNPPKFIGTVAPNVPPARLDSIIGNRNADPPAPAFSGGVRGGTGNAPIVRLPDEPPPPAPNPPPAAPKTIKVSQGVLTSKVISLPKPIYPPMARQIRLSGSVSVQVLIDEGGRVVSAKAVSGHPLLVLEAQKAALQARFSPTMLGEQAVKVSGVITYNFVMP